VGVFDMVIGDYKFRSCPAVENSESCVWVPWPFVFWPKILAAAYGSYFFGPMRVQISDLARNINRGWGLR